MSSPPAPKLQTKSLLHRIVVSVLGVLVLALPGIVAAIVFTPDAAAPLLLGAVVGAASAMSAGRRIALFQVFLLLLAAPVAVVSGQVPIAGAGFMALLCLASGMTALWGMNNSFTLIPLVLAYPLIHPPALGSIAVDRNSTAYVLTLSLLLFVGGLWMALVIPVVARHRELPELHPATRRDAVSYTVLITVLCSANTFAVLLINPSSEGAWLILTLIAVTQLGPLKTVRRTAYRLGGTIAGALIAAGIAWVVPGEGAQLALALACLMTAMFFRGGGSYWLYVSFMTPSVVLLSSTGNVTATSEYRVLYTVIGASQVLLASAMALGYQHLRSSGRAQATELKAQPLAADTVAE